ncbi:transcription termination/antitermination protein NusG [Chitinilyticum piscinae]|uniref:Transcription termination/antitermination protein NusG n=1 Tax=Chitinilyticum piscinae TaxID=2866724 RepID=A0A8J7FGY0_9NEIS|nr:transcription termination/antitermination protein NusG [Chitinilyticum piscinae]MBE9608965.1 transcription termination/antitermination protein NusG [Chitinilyticum piscinae]
MAMRWYVVHAYSGFEKSVQRALKERFEREGLADLLGQVLVPVEEVMEVKNGRKSLAERKLFPGYVYVEMEMTDESWHLVKSTPKVTGFLGGVGNRPLPVSAKEMEAVLRQVQEGVEKPKPKIMFEVGETLRVTEGPFADFNATVESIDYDKSRLKVSVSIFGRATPVEVDFSQVEKV